MAEATDNVSDTTMQLAEVIPDFYICSNCLGGLQETAPSICGHRYCLSCISQWLVNMTCSCCTQQLLHNSLIQDQLFYSFIGLLPRHAQTLRKHLEMTVDICQKEIQLLKDQLTLKEEYFKKETETLLHKLSVAQAEITEKDQQWKEAENKFENEKNQTRQLTEELKESHHNYRMLEISLEFLTRENAMQKDQLESLQHIDETCQLLEEKFTDIEQDRRSLIGEIGRTSSENQDLVKQVAEYKWWSLLRGNPDVSQLKQELADANESKERMHEHIKSLLSQIDRLTEDLYKKEQELIYSSHFSTLEQ